MAMLLTGVACGEGGRSAAESSRGGPAVVTVATTAPANPPVTLPTTTTSPTTTAAPTTTTLAADAVQQVELGRSVEGRPIVAVERGAPGGTVVLVIGVIHGDEPAGAAIVRELATREVPPGVDLWLVPSANPDGQARGTRTNAHRVDLNRNFPYRWSTLGEPGDPEYAGTGPASEPETQAVVNLVNLIRPELAVWYHQDLNRIAPGDGRAGRVRRRYAELTGLPVLPVTGGTYTGTASTWEQKTVPKGVSFIVELDSTLTVEQATTHAVAVLTLASDLHR
jgi:murein peptide amidase A